MELFIPILMAFSVFMGILSASIALLEKRKERMVTETIDHTWLFKKLENEKSKRNAQ